MPKDGSCSSCLAAARRSQAGAGKDRLLRRGLQKQVERRELRGSDLPQVRDAQSAVQQAVLLHHHPPLPQLSVTTIFILSAQGHKVLRAGPTPCKRQQHPSRISSIKRTLLDLALGEKKIS
ncbi:hypothetical protein Taro_050926 [Colocasia esculenta]|uniref:Uncharacterized protein n=1 Tax=Colocasia esculenta TaxID=4460 RepID=A0A843XF99_COLES|nr:hypothetical protein [Colocasia esculenta]